MPRREKGGREGEVEGERKRRRTIQRDCKKVFAEDAGKIWGR